MIIISLTKKNFNFNIITLPYLGEELTKFFTLVNYCDIINNVYLCIFLRR